MEKKRIRTPKELESSIKVIKVNIAEGTIQEIEGAQYPLNEIDVNSNRPDVIHNEFQCLVCEQRFILSVETYHGAGGFWDFIDELG